MTAVMTTVAIIQARMGSTRLPGKVLADLGGRPVLDWTVAAARAIPGIAQVAVATSDQAPDDAIAEWCGITFLNSALYCLSVRILRLAMSSLK